MSTALNVQNEEPAYGRLQICTLRA